MAYSTPFLSAIKIRRSILSLSKESPISDDRIVMCVNHAIKHAPSPFSVQSCRAIVLFGADHDKLWDIGLEEKKKELPPPVFAIYEPKIKEYKAAYGTVMFFEDTEASKNLPQPLQQLLGQYPDWYEHAQGMTQFVAWTALANEGLGCNLQHYHPTITTRIAQEWDIPTTWRPTAQLVFGTAIGPPRGGVEKKFAPLEGRVKVYGSAAKAPGADV